MSENIKQSAEERPQLGLDYRGLWCAVIENAIDDAAEEFDPKELEELFLMGANRRKAFKKESKFAKLIKTRRDKAEAIMFLKSKDLDLICDLFLDGIHADTIRRGLE